MTAGIFSVVIAGHFGGGDHFDGGDHFGGGTVLQRVDKPFSMLMRTSATCLQPRRHIVWNVKNDIIYLLDYIHTTEAYTQKNL